MKKIETDILKLIIEMQGHFEQLQDRNRQLDILLSDVTKISLDDAIEYQNEVEKNDACLDILLTYSKKLAKIYRNSEF